MRYLTLDRFQPKMKFMKCKEWYVAQTLMCWWVVGSGVGVVLVLVDGSIMRGCNCLLILLTYSHVVPQQRFELKLYCSPHSSLQGVIHQAHAFYCQGRFIS